MANAGSPAEVPQNCPNRPLLDPMVERNSHRFANFSSSRRRFVTIIGLFLLLALIGSFSLNHSKETPKAPAISSEELKRLQKQSLKSLYNHLLEDYHENVRLPIHRLSYALEPLTSGRNLTDEERMEAEGSCGTFLPRRIAYTLRRMETACNGSHLNKEAFDFLHRLMSHSYLTNSENNRARELFTRVYFHLDNRRNTEQSPFNEFWAKYKSNDNGYMNATSLLESLYSDFGTSRQIFNASDKGEVKTQCLPLAVYVASGFKGHLLMQLRDEVVDHIEELRKLTEICSKTEANRKDSYLYKMRVFWELSSVEHFIKKLAQSLLHETWPEIETHFARAILRENIDVRNYKWDNATLTAMADELYRGIKEIGHPDYDHQVVIVPSRRPIQPVEQFPESPNFYCKVDHCSIIREQGVKVIIVRQKPLDETQRKHLNNFADEADEAFKTAYERDGYRLNVQLPQMELKYRVRFSEFERHSAVYFLNDQGYSIDNITYGVAGEELDPPAYRTIGFEKTSSSYNIHWSFLIF